MEKQNKFKIVIPSYNNAQWVEPNLASILNQTYTNYEVLYIDDASTDNTFDLVNSIVGENPLFKIQRNEKNMRRGYNTSPEMLNDFFDDGEDILTFIDGDDWLAYPDTLEKLNQFYNKKDPWMTYGKMVVWKGGDEYSWPFPQNSEYPQAVHENNLYRRDLWRASHLRTFKWHLYKRMKSEDLKYSKTNEYYFQAQDLATSFPCLEMCPSDRIGVVDFLTYVFNESKSNQVRAKKRIEEAGGKPTDGTTDLEKEIRLIRTPYKTLNDNSVSVKLAGGLANLLFEVATAYSYSKQHNKKLLLPNIHSLPMQGNNVINYVDNIFRNFRFKDISYNHRIIPQKSFQYDPLPSYPNENIVLDGHFQSYKYFDLYSDEIKTLLQPDYNTLEYIKDKYGDILNKTTTSIHVRRGDYLKLPDHYINLDYNYYTKALSKTPHSDYILVFSDDISWCKQTFKGDQYIFIENEKDYIDLYLMSMCNNNIIANSTFSWWGAWLNNNPDKVVVSPNQWFGPAKGNRNLNDLIPENWIKI